VENTKQHNLKERLHEVIFEADTKKGKLFDQILLVMIIASVVVVMLESVEAISSKYHDVLYILEWFFTILFTIEYILRLYSTYKPVKYATSFFGIIDLLSILPTYLGLIFVAGIEQFAVIRALRLLRVFRIFKMIGFLRQGKIILLALRKSREKILVFLFFVFIVASIFGTMMHLIEGGSNENFDNIPRSIYWAIVTITTVGYGDISPTTPLGQMIAALVMLLGYAVIAVPTGIVSSEMVMASKKENDISTQACRFCSKEGHDEDAIHCKFCGELLNAPDD